MTYIDNLTDSKLESLIDYKSVTDEDEKEYLYPHIDLFPLKEVPKKGQWLDAHPEKGQDYLTFTKKDANLLNSENGKIYLVPLGTFEESVSPNLEKLRDYCYRYFCIETVILEPGLKHIEDNKTKQSYQYLDNSFEITSRINQYSDKLQLLTTDVLETLAMIKINLEDSYCVVAVTMDDLYPQSSWNFVFGQADMNNMVAVFSFARYSPRFYDLFENQNPLDKDDYNLLVMRSCSVLTHEIGHLFGIYHCVYFECCMNGSNSLPESDAQPLYLCPICLRKLQYVSKFNIGERYKLLYEFFISTPGFETEKSWLKKVLKRYIGLGVSLDINLEDNNSNNQN